MNAICYACGAPATCIGRYEAQAADQHACDTCCGHGNEDGHCVPVPCAVQPVAFEFAAHLDAVHLREVPRRFWPVHEIQGEFGEALRRIADDYGACPSCYRSSTFRKIRDERGSIVGGVCGQCRHECSTPPPSAARIDGGAL